MRTPIWVIWLRYELRLFKWRRSNRGWKKTRAKERAYARFVEQAWEDAHAQILRRNGLRFDARGRLVRL